MTPERQQQAINFLAESSQRFSNATRGQLAQETAWDLMDRINKFLGEIEDETGMTNIPEVK